MSAAILSATLHFRTTSRKNLIEMEWNLICWCGPIRGITLLILDYVAKLACLIQGGQQNGCNIIRFHTKSRECLIEMKRNLVCLAYVDQSVEDSCWFCAMWATLIQEGWQPENGCQNDVIWCFRTISCKCLIEKKQNLVCLCRPIKGRASLILALCRPFWSKMANKIATKQCIFAGFCTISREFLIERNQNWVCLCRPIKGETVFILDHVGHFDPRRPTKSLSKS